MQVRLLETICSRAGPRHGEVPPSTVEKCRPPKPWVKAKSSLSGRNDFIIMHHKAGVNFENFTEVKFRDILLTGMGHRDRRLNRDSPGQTGTYGRSNLNQNLKPKPKSNFRFIRERPFAIPSFRQKCRPRALPSPPCRGPVHGQNHVRHRALKSSQTDAHKMITVLGTTATLHPNKIQCS